MDRSGDRKIEEAGICLPTWKSKRFYAGFARQSDVAYPIWQTDNSNLSFAAGPERCTMRGGGQLGFAEVKRLSSWEENIQED